MPRNPLLYPNNFVLDGTVTDSGITALEIAVKNLNSAAKSGAMRQANGIRISGLNSIKNQNRGMPTLNSLLPTRSVGKFTAPPSEPTGTVGYFVSGWGDTSQGQSIFNQRTRTDRFTFATDTITSLGARIDPHWHYTFANINYGYVFAGASSSNRAWRFTFQTETFALLGSTLFPNRYNGASLKNQARGYACTGVSAGTAYGEVDRFTFAGEVCVSIGSILQPRSGSSGFGNRFNGYIGGGLANAVASNFTSNIEKFAYASETKSAITSALSVVRNAMATWLPGSALASYLIAGQSSGSFPNPGVSANRTYNNNIIDKFTFAGETCVSIATTLSKGVASYGAVGNSTRCVIGGGTVHTDAYNVQSTYTSESTEIRAFTFVTETNTLVANALSVGRYLLSGLDNSTF